MALPSWSERLAEAAASKRERTKLLVNELGMGQRLEQRKG